MIYWSILQASETASLFILATIFFAFVTVVGVIRSGRHGEHRCTARIMVTIGHPDRGKDFTGHGRHDPES